MTLWQSQFEQNLKQLAKVTSPPETASAPSVISFKQTSFLSYLQKFIDATPGLAAIYPQALEPNIISACNTLYRYPTLVEHLSLMAQLLPSIYNSSIFSALASFSIAKSLGYEEERMELAFLAGLLHDIGFLYYPVSHDYNHFNESSIADAAIRAHGPVAAGVVRRLDNAPAHLADIIRDHHEHFNGTGYPNRKSADTLHCVVFIINIADMIIRAAKEYAIYPKHSHQLIRLVLLLNQEQIPDEIYRTAIKLILQKPDCTDTPEVIPETRELRQQRAKICKAMTTMASALKLLQKNQAIDGCRAATRIHRQLQATFQHIGIEQQEYDEWLAQQEGECSLEIVNSHVIQNEVCHQLARLFTALIEANKSLCPLEISLKTQVTDLLSTTVLPALVMPALPTPRENLHIPKMNSKNKQ